MQNQRLPASRSYDARATVAPILPAPAPPDQTCLPAEARKKRPDGYLNLYFPLPFGPHSTPGQRSNLKVELHLSVNDGAGEVAVMRHRAGGSTSWDSYCSHM